MKYPTKEEVLANIPEGSKGIVVYETEKGVKVETFGDLTMYDVFAYYGYLTTELTLVRLEEVQRRKQEEWDNRPGKEEG